MSLGSDSNISTFRDMPLTFQFALERWGYSSCPNISYIIIIKLQ